MLKNLILPALIVGISVLIVLGLVAGREPPDRRAEEDRAMLVNVVEAQRAPVRFTVESQGTVAPRTQTTLVAEVAGKVVEVAPNFVAGGFFREGDVLLRIDPSDYEVAVKRAEAALAGRQAQLAQEQARAAQARRDWKQLERRGEEPSPLLLREPQLAEAQANVRAAEADLAKARRDLERTRIGAPYDGLVRAKQADVGQYVGPGTAVGVTFAVDQAEVRLPLSDRDLAFLELPDFTGLAPDELPGVRLSATIAGQRRTREGTIVRTEGVFDVQTRVMHAVARIIDPYSAFGEIERPVLPVGTFVSAEIDGRFAGEVVQLPRHTVQPDGTVLIASPEDVLEIRPIEILREAGDVVYIAEGLRHGDRVVTTSVEVPIPGTRLQISGAESGAEAVAAAPGGQAARDDATAATPENTP